MQALKITKKVISVPSNFGNNKNKNSNNIVQFIQPVELIKHFQVTDNIVTREFNEPVF